MLMKATPNPLQRPRTPSDLNVFFKQSHNPEYSLQLVDRPKSTAILVLAKSRGCTKQVVVLPASPPQSKLQRKNSSFELCLVQILKSLPQKSLVEKLRACVGKYLITLTPFPLQRDRIPSYLMHLLKQSMIPLYLSLSLVFQCSVCSKSLTLSMGAVRVLAVIPARPPAKKSNKSKQCPPICFGWARFLKGILCQYNQMKQYDVETQLSDLLTSYIQHFKSVLSTKLTLIQSLCLNSNSLQANPQFLLSKFSNKKFQNDWPTDPQLYLVDSDQSSTLTRFYLRIQEYLQYRLGPLVNVNEGVFSSEVANFQKQLERAVRKFQANLSETKSISQLLAIISQLQISFTSQLIEKIKTSKPTLVKGILDVELIDEIKEFFNKKINKQQLQGLKRINLKNQVQEARQLRLSFSNNFQSLRVKNSFRKKIYSKREQPVSNFTNLFCSPFNHTQKIIWCDKETNQQEDETNEIQHYINQAQKRKIQTAYSLLQLEQSTKTAVNKEDLFVELQHRNLKNKMHLNTYLNKYERKIRKGSLRQETEKGYKSTAKAIKNNTPNHQQASIFLQKIQNFQLFTPITKKYSESLKKGQTNNIELPLIASRHNRRTTVQK